MFDPSNMTDETLKQELITNDYHGKEIKRLALDELLSRAERKICLNERLNTMRWYDVIPWHMIGGFLLGYSAPILQQQHWLPFRWVGVLVGICLITLFFVLKFNKREVVA